ncbi:hypothetical protein METH_05270 [Leisingera methylohalidivorans DSM 14336]|uniref:Uncharacterized protein n=1 Tax=Leisingera methylohalidivorans DSM 14336 TaxID=999552 RepID=V9VYS9_9RHOB|nr:hypothetical protein METH_05270 [Leisingera methylohalidivorans DSM 14336]
MPLGGNFRAINRAGPRRAKGPAPRPTGKVHSMEGTAAGGSPPPR